MKLKEELIPAKNYLDSVRIAKKDAVDKAYRIDEIKTTSKKLIASYELATGGSGKKSDMSGYLALIEEAVEAQTVAMQIYIKKQKEIQDCIDKLNVNMNVRHVLSMRYISFQKWSSIAKAMDNCSIRHIYRLHNEGLEAVLKKIFYKK